MKKLLLSSFIFISYNSYSQLTTFNSGDVILKSEINQNFRHLESYASQYHFPVQFGDYTNETVIQANKFNIDIGLVNSKFLPSTNLPNVGGTITSEKLNNLFQGAKAYITDYIGKSCLDLRTKNTSLINNGFYKIKPTDSPSDFWAYCDMQKG